jgi:hypothetical protein
LEGVSSGTDFYSKYINFIGEIIMKKIAIALSAATIAVASTAASAWGGYGPYGYAPYGYAPVAPAVEMTEEQKQAIADQQAKYMEDMQKAQQQAAEFYANQRAAMIDMYAPVDDIRAQRMEQREARIAEMDARMEERMKAAELRAPMTDMYAPMDEVRAQRMEQREARIAEMDARMEERMKAAELRAPMTDMYAPMDDIYAQRMEQREARIAEMEARMDEYQKAADARRAEYEAARKARFQEISTQGEETKAADDKGA